MVQVNSVETLGSGKQYVDTAGLCCTSSGTQYIDLLIFHHSGSGKEYVKTLLTFISLLQVLYGFKS